MGWFSYWAIDNQNEATNCLITQDTDNCGSKVPEKVSWQTDESKARYLWRSPGRKGLLRQRMSLGYTAWRKKHNSPAPGLLRITAETARQIRTTLRDHREVCLCSSPTSTLPITRPRCPMMPHKHSPIRSCKPPTLLVGSAVPLWTSPPKSKVVSWTILSG